MKGNLHLDTQRFLPSGDEAGTAPEDRAFRPDVEGLRAVSIVLVILVHAGVPYMQGGTVGVDAFFVISGFVITGLLLREHTSTGGVSFLPFYARRCSPNTADGDPGDCRGRRRHRHHCQSS